MFEERVTVTGRLRLPVDVRVHSTVRSACHVLGRRSIHSVKNVVRDFDNSISCVGGFLSLNVRVSVDNIIAFGGTARLRRITGIIPVRGLLIRASTPCLTPIPFHKGQGRPTCMHCMTRGVTRLHRRAFKRVTLRAAGGTGGLFKLRSG